MNIIKKVNPSVSTPAVELPSARSSARAAAGGAGAGLVGGHSELEGYALGSKRRRGPGGYDERGDYYDDMPPVEGQASTEMVACEHNMCPKEWYTLPQAGLTPETIPEGKWYCPDCRLDPNDYSRGRQIPRSETRCPPLSAEQCSVRIIVISARDATDFKLSACRPVLVGLLIIARAHHPISAGLEDKNRGRSRKRVRQGHPAKRKRTR